MAKLLQNLSGIEPFKDTVRSLSMFFLISIFSTKYLFSYNNIIIIRKPIH